MAEATEHTNNSDSTKEPTTNVNQSSPQSERTENNNTNDNDEVASNTNQPNNEEELDNPSNTKNNSKLNHRNKSKLNKSNNNNSNLDDPDSKDKEDNDSENKSKENESNKGSKNKDTENKEEKDKKDSDSKEEDKESKDTSESSSSESKSSKKSGIKNKLNSVKDKAKNAPKNAADAVKNAPHKAADKIKHGAKSAKNKVAAVGKNKADAVKANVSNKLDHTLVGQVKKAKANGATGITALGKGAKNRFKQTESYEKIQELIKKVTKVIKFVVNHIKLFGILAAIIGIVFPVVILIISYTDSLGSSPHYYCDIDADPSVKKTAIYQQYCSELKGFEFEQLDGHYMVQDGSGPCLATSKMNLALRYYTLRGINFYDYLFQQDGKYLSTAKNVTKEGQTGIENTLRAAANNGSAGTCSSEYKCHDTAGNYIRGYKWFAEQHGQRNVTMANWGYCGDEGIVTNEWENPNEHEDLKSNDNWYWDLSLLNNSRGSTWSVGSFSVNTTIEGIPCKYKSIMAGKSGFGNEEWISSGVSYGMNGCKDELIDAFDEYSWACTPDASPGVLFYYYTGTGHHAVLITKYEKNPDGTYTWYIVDPGIGVSGGFEGPIQPSGIAGQFNIGSHADGLLALINGGPNAYKLCGMWIVDPECFGTIFERAEELKNMQNP